MTAHTEKLSKHSWPYVLNALFHTSTWESNSSGSRPLALRLLHLHSSRVMELTTSQVNPAPKLQTLAQQIMSLLPMNSMSVLNKTVSSSIWNPFK